MPDDRTIDQRAASVAVEPAGPPVAGTLHYPDSDGRFLPENPLQARAIIELRESLRRHFAGGPPVVLEGDMFIYYEEGTLKSVAPDVYVVLDHDLGNRLVYKLWEEGKPPDFAVEVISPTSEVHNTVRKRALYERLGIGEYFVFQPDQEREGPRLVAYSLQRGRYVGLLPDGDGAIRSERLGVSLRAEGAKIRVRDLASGEDYSWAEELDEEREADRDARRQAESRAETAELRAETAELRAETEAEARRKSDLRAKSEAEARRKSDLRANSAAEAQRRAELQAKSEAEARRRLEARLAELGASLGEASDD